jgi:uncharacterized membrane protein
MSRLFIPTLVLHVVVAVMGLGNVILVPIVAAAARKNRQNTKEIFSWLSPFLRLSAVSLAVMLVTGILLDFAAQGGFRHSWWFRGSALLLLITGALHGQGRRAIRSGLADGGKGYGALRRIERIGYAMCVLVLAITILMVVKPF